ncbi:plasmid pRiA4b ORF-3 family protein [Ornithinimicrobium faecis]|uniref:Plasmid pRiA4b ORF-3 family protein n=1 Tax=Ornithinimicrobium faecis TaxID=2934158 RepID=A0ABY4YR95_9MICO|nr:MULTISPECIES: plasmid pRiA4b ORF-3 family protein [unclassified Ornithinimicrobium]USQ78800.1 plasmid pRiA4b ORF-3 family protein [Ornithinimicrobium sp. HY1793]
MARTWLSVTVELLGGRGEVLWPRPGRIFAVGPSHTFVQLAEAVNDAFARWDRAHLSVFTLGDGRVITDEHTGAEFASLAGGPVTTPVDMDTATVSRLLQPGEEFLFTFDLGDEWRHLCTVGEKVDPMEVLGVRPGSPLPYWGWGSVPDQYGRRWRDDDGESPPPPRPAHPHPMQTGLWPGQEQRKSINLQELRSAVQTADTDRFLAVLQGCDIDDVLQLVGAGIPMALEQRGADVEPLAVSVINRLSTRGAEGDDVLAEDLLAVLRGEALQGRVVPADLEVLASELERSAEMSLGGYLDLQTGEVWDESLTDAAMVGEDSVLDVEEEPDRWLRFDTSGSRDAWRDMAAFAERQWDAALRARLEQAIEGRGAFRRFRDVVEEEGMVDLWRAFSQDLAHGRARALLAREGIRVGRPDDSTA